MTIYKIPLFYRSTIFLTRGQVEGFPGRRGGRFVVVVVDALVVEELASVGVTNQRLVVVDEKAN